MEINTINIITIFLSAAGFWKFIEVILKLGPEKRHKRAETGDVIAHANSQIVNNWMDWSKKLEERIGQLEARVKEQNERIRKLEADNRDLKGQIEKLKQGV